MGVKNPCEKRVQRKIKYDEKHLYRQRMIRAAQVFFCLMDAVKGKDAGEPPGTLRSGRFKEGVRRGRRPAGVVYFSMESVRMMNRTDPSA